MSNVTLVCTRHQELGNCNSSELSGIIDKVNPEVVFEEMPPSQFDINSAHNLEASTIIRYSEHHTIKRVPIDSDEVPPESFFQEHRCMLERIEGLADRNGFDYRTLTDRHRINVFEGGFNYLNSAYCETLNSEIYGSIERGLEAINDKMLFQTYKLWNEIVNKREDVMLENIYTYSRFHGYDRALFLVGSAHRKSLMQKIPIHEEVVQMKLNWKFMGEL